jgi:hypothetical protein
VKIAVIFEKRIHSNEYTLFNTYIIRGSERFVHCIQRVGEDRIKFDCERCAKRQFAEFMPSAPNGTVFSPVSSPGFQTYLSVYIIYLRYYFSF